MTYGILGAICAIAALASIVLLDPSPPEGNAAITTVLIVVAALLLGIWAGGRRHE